MNRQWMYNADRRSMEFINGVHEFIDVAKKHKHGGFFRCPCQLCKNEKDYSSTRTIHSHLFHNEDGEEEDDFVPHFEHNYHDAGFEDTAMGEPEEDAEGHVVEDDLGQMLREAEKVCETEKESRDLKCMLEDYRTLLYPDCKQDQKKLGTTLELLQWKASNGLSETYKKLTP